MNLKLTALAYCVFMRPMKLYDSDEVFDVGKKHKGQFIRDVLYQDPLYLNWCVEQVEWFVLADKVKLLCIETMKKALHESSTNVIEFEEQLEKVFIGNFESICRKKKAQYFFRRKEK